MKNLFVILFMFTVFSACSNDDNLKSCETGKIVGKWKLIKVEYPFPPSTHQYDKSIIYNFRVDGKLIVTGGENAGYSNGEYNYIFKKDYFSEFPPEEGPKVWFVEINGSKWTYKCEDGLMVLGQSYVDGPDLFFQRL